MPPQNRRDVEPAVGGAAAVLAPSMQEWSPSLTFEAIDDRLVESRWADHWIAFDSRAEAARTATVAGPGCVGGGGQVAMVTAERIRGRQVSIDIDEVPGIGWVAIGIIDEGLGPEKGMRFEARAADRSEAERRLKMEIEAALA
jgi:hypothetical protein